MNINETWLVSNGVTVSGDELQKLVAKAQGEWELRVGNALAKELTNEQIAEFEKLEDEDKRLAWLSKAYPGYTTVVEREAQKMDKELKAAANKVALIESWSEG